MDNKKILDACCGSRMFWFNKENKILFTWIIGRKKQRYVTEEN